MSWLFTIPEDHDDLRFSLNRFSHCKGAFRNSGAEDCYIGRVRDHQIGPLDRKEVTYMESA